MGFFRSENMIMCEMLLHTESAFECLVELGYLCSVQFRNSFESEIATNQIYTSEVQRCNDMQRVLQFLQRHVDECGLTAIYYPNVDQDEIPSVSDMHQIGQVLQQVEMELIEVERHRDELDRRYLLMEEKLYVLKKGEEFFMGITNADSVMAWSDSIIMQLIHDDTRQLQLEDLRSRTQPKSEFDTIPPHRLGFFSGSIPVDRYHPFELMLWRLCGHNFFLRRSEIPMLLYDPKRPTIKVRKYAFIVCFLGQPLGQKISKVCLAFSALLFEYPETYQQRLDLRKKITADSEDLQIVMQHADAHRLRLLRAVTGDLFIWRSKLKKMQMVYTTLNKMGTLRHMETTKYLQVECWIPQSDFAKVRQALYRGAIRAAKGALSFPPSITEITYRRGPGREPPTFFRLNKFTNGFQNLINSYGVPVYKELNPAPYTIITFPFLFAVMFGDIGHGIIMSLFAAWMCIKEKPLQAQMQMERKPNEIFSLLFAGRYIILLMGLFSIYTGFIYNDLFSKSLNLFGSHWSVNYTKAEVQALTHHRQLELNPEKKEFYEGTPYIFGMDPMWGIAGEDAITTFNSLKMKMAIILGISQMMLGMCLSAWNYTYLGSTAELVLVFLPQITFLTCLFAYLVILVLYKWIMYGGHYKPPYNTACAPSLLITFIDMLLMKDSQVKKPGCNAEIYGGQKIIQGILLALAFLSVPILLMGKPLHFMYTEKKIQLADARRKQELKAQKVSSLRKSLYNLEFAKESAHALKLDLEHLDPAEVWIHSGIHTIESVLGAVSHTASYLRLWALSLAHDQLSTVLWKMVLALGLQSKNGYLGSLMLYAMFWLWAILTVAILVVMEGLSAFLHTLRLHWVEFQSKFYEGAGESFTPFCFPPSRIE